MNYFHVEFSKPTQPNPTQNYFTWQYILTLTAQVKVNFQVKSFFVEPMSACPFVNRSEIGLCCS